MRDAIPIVFIHYGISDYLEYSLKSAKYSNPNKELHLIGDKENISLSRLVDNHSLFSDFNAQKIQSLNHRYILIGSNNIYLRKDVNKREYFEYFCFLRWFVLEEYMLKNKIDRVWYFDSDTMIISDLRLLESKIHTYTYDNGNMKGLINLKNLQKYTSAILNMYADTPFLFHHYIGQQKHRSHTINDMTAFQYYRMYLSSGQQSEEGLKLQSVKSLYCDQALNIADEFKTRFSFIAFTNVKKIVYIKGEAYLEPQIGNKVKLMTYSASWLPFVYRKYLFLRHFKGKKTSIKYIILNMHLVLMAWIKAPLGKI